MKNIHRMAMLLVLTGTLVVGIQPERARSQNNSGKGTLGLLIITKEGMVLAADSRTTYSDGRHDDQAVKIFRLGRSSACTIAGTVFVQRTPFVRGFDLREEIRKVSVSPRATDDPDFFRTTLSRQLEAAISSTAARAPVGESFEDDAQVASILIGGYALPRGEPMLPGRYFEKAFRLSLLSGPTPGIEGGAEVAGHGQTHPEIVRSDQVLDVQGTGRVAIFTNGNDGLLRSILAHRKAYFVLTRLGRLREIPLSNLNREQELNTYFELRDRNDLDSMSLTEAVRLADTLIRVNIELAGDDLGIGGQVDIATITREDGFRWVPGHSPREFDALAR